jgi:hypothetical protein
MTTAITATQVQIGQLRDGQKIWTFTAADASASSSAGVVITLPKTKIIFGTPVISVVASGATSAVAVNIVSVSVTGNVITAVASAAAAAGTATYTGIVCGK